MIGTFHNNRFTICKLLDNQGKDTTMVSYMLHYVLFNENMNVVRSYWINKISSTD